jgi:hypothetical protein
VPHRPAASDAGVEGSATRYRSPLSQLSSRSVVVGVRKVIVAIATALAYFRPCANTESKEVVGSGHLKAAECGRLTRCRCGLPGQKSVITLGCVDD